MSQQQVQFWAAQSPTTSLGDNPAVTAAVTALPDNDIAAIRNATTQHVFHFRGNYDGEGVPPERKSEIGLRYASSLLETLLSRGGSLSETRPPPGRVVGTSRDAVVLFLSLARAKGIPARGRVGFTFYPDEEWWIDHVVAEAWDAKEERWRLVEAYMAGEDGKDNTGKIDLLDLPEEDFITGPKAWQAVREGKLNPARFGIAPDDGLPPFLKGWHYLAHNVLHDLAWLDGKEMLLWDHWGMQDGMSKKSPEDVKEELGALLDEIAAVTAETGVEPDAVRALAGREGLRVPSTVSSVDPVGGGMIDVDVSRAVA